jgi:hypothetical protein
MNGRPESMSADNIDAMWRQVEQDYSTPSTSRQKKVVPRKTPRYQFKKAKFNMTGVRGPNGLELFFGIMDGEQAGACHKKWSLPHN